MKLSRTARLLFIYVPSQSLSIGETLQQLGRHRGVKRGSQLCIEVGSCWRDRVHTPTDIGSVRCQVTHVYIVLVGKPLG
jgi:hypothetical protein